MGVGAPVAGKYKRIFTTYSEDNLVEINAIEELCDGRKYKLKFDLRPYESIIFEIPFVEETEEERKEHKKVQTAIKKQFNEIKNDLSHVPQVEVPEALKKNTSEKKPASAKKSSAKKKS